MEVIDASGRALFCIKFSIYPNNAPRDNTNVHPVACKPQARPIDESRRIPPYRKKMEACIPPLSTQSPSQSIKMLVSLYCQQLSRRFT